MRVVAAIGNERDIVTVSSFLRVVEGVTEVYAIAVVPPDSGGHAVADASLRRFEASLDRLRIAQREAADALLRAFRTRIGRNGGDIETDVAFGVPAEEIIDTASRARADFIFVGKWHEDKHDGTSPGQVAARVARYAHCAVVLIDPLRPVPRSVMYATDGSEEARFAGEQLRRLAIRGPLSLTLSTVTPTPSLAFVKTGTIVHTELQRVMAELRRDQETQTRKFLMDLMEEFREARYRARVLQTRGDPAEAIVQTVREAGIDLVVLGARGMSVAGRFLLGSTTLKVMDQAPCSMIVTRRPVHPARLGAG